MNKRGCVWALLAWLVAFGCPCLSHGQELCEMVLIPAGEYTMGTDQQYGEGAAHRVYVAAFYRDRYEVTNRQCCTFLNEMDNRVESGRPWLDLKRVRIERIDGRFTPLVGYEDHPVVAVNWYGARAHASCRSCRLPTEAEWEKAARGGLEQPAFPWGDEIDPGMANYGQERASTAPVGSYPANGYGLHDIAGNVWEWCTDWYGFEHYEASPYADPTGPSLGEALIVRGGGWDGPVHVYAKYLRCSFCNFLRPESSAVYLGFRCACSAGR
jgi:formylglycine-generating enzyme required for sulfatase activity